MFSISTCFCSKGVFLRTIPRVRREVMCPPRQGLQIRGPLQYQITVHTNYKLCVKLRFKAFLALLQLVEIFFSLYQAGELFYTSKNRSGVNSINAHKICSWIFINMSMSLDPSHDSRFMKSNFHKNNSIKILEIFIFMILHKNTENYWWWHGSLSLFCTFMEYESRLHNTIFL